LEKDDFFKLKKSQFKKETTRKIFCLSDNIITVHYEEAVATVISFLLNILAYMDIKMQFEHVWIRVVKDIIKQIVCKTPENTVPTCTPYHGRHACLPLYVSTSWSHTGSSSQQGLCYPLSSFSHGYFLLDIFGASSIVTSSQRTSLTILTKVTEILQPFPEIITHHPAYYFFAAFTTI
jgi:hypothetical protein